MHVLKKQADFRNENSIIPESDLSFDSTAAPEKQLRSPLWSLTASCFKRHLHIHVLRACFSNTPVKPKSCVILSGIIKISFLCKFIYIALFFISFFPKAYANDYAVTKRYAEVVKSDNQYALNTGFNFHLSPKAKQALQNGIPLYWNLKIRLMQQRKFWWNKTLSNIDFNYRIQYLALLNLYRVKNLSTGEVDNLSTLTSALDVIANLQKLQLIDTRQLQVDQQYQVKIKLDFVREKLPLPLRPSSYLDSQWYLSSAWFLCPIQQ